MSVASRHFQFNSCEGPTVNSVLKSTVYFLTALSLPSGILSGQTKQTSVEKALEISSTTGRPIFVMAGQET